MSVSRETFDPVNAYKRVVFHQDRDVLDSELNEAQSILHDNVETIFGAFMSSGAILSGCGIVSAVGNLVTVEAGTLYVRGTYVTVDRTTLAFGAATSGENYVWVEVLRRAVTAADDSTLVNTWTGEPTAEREQWVASLKIADTLNDALPTGASGRYTAKVYTFNRATGALTPSTSSFSPAQFAAMVAHLGSGGTAHSVATAQAAGFMSATDKTRLDAHIGASGAAHSAATTQAAGFMSATDKGALDGHLGAGGTAHAVATTQAAGFMSATDKTRFEGHVGVGGTTHPVATTESAGFMSPSDKTKLDGVSTEIVSPFTRGMILMWSGSLAEVPSGWGLCDGELHDGVQTPDLQGKFIVGVNPSQNSNALFSEIGEVGGAASVQLAETNLPLHSHTVTSHSHTLAHVHPIAQHAHSIGSHIHGQNLEARRVSYILANAAAGSDVTNIVSNETFEQVTPEMGIGWTDAGGSGSTYNGGTTTTDAASATLTGSAAPTTTGVGSGTDVPTLPPYYALAFIMKL